MADSELERVFVTFLANDKDLEKSYAQVVRRAKEVSSEVSKAFEAGASKGFTDAGEKVARSAKRQADAVDEVEAAFKALRNETAALRHTVEAGDTAQQDAIKRFNELQQAALHQARGFEVTTDEYRKFTQVAAQASRSVATLEGRATKLGFSANAAVGITAALNQNLAMMGPAGRAAGAAVGIISSEMSALMQLKPGTIFRGLASGIGVLTVAATTLAVAAIAAAGTALYKLGVEAAKTADEIDKASRSIGFTAEAFQEVSFALEQSGLSIDQTRQGLQDMNARLGQAANGTASIVDAYSRLGVAIRDSNGAVRDSEDVFTDLIGSLSRVPSAAEKAALGGIVFGEEFSRRVIPALEGGAKGFADLREQARSMGLVISNNGIKSLVEFKDELNILKKQFETAKIEITAGLIPVFTNLLIPLLQNTVVPWIQATADKVVEFTDSLRDTGPAGREFRTGLAESFAPLVSLVGYLQAAGASLDVLNYKVQLNGAQMNQFWRELGRGVTELPDTVKRFLGIEVSQPSSGGRDSSGETRLIREARASLAQAEALLADAIYKIENPGDITLAWLEGIAADVREGASAFDLLGDSADNAGRALAGVAPPPVGSLAAFHAEVQAAQKAFNLAVLDEDRDAARERERIAQEAIAAILAAYQDPDILAAARAWTGRLTAELQQGVKDNATVADLITAGIENVREEASQAFGEFGWDHADYRDAVTKLEFLEGFLQRLTSSDPTLTIRVDTSRAEADMQAALSVLQQRFSGDNALIFTLQAVERTQGRFTSLEEAFAGLAKAGIVITAPMLELLTQRFQQVEEAADHAAEAVAALRRQELERHRGATSARWQGDAGLVFTATAVERTEGQFQSLEDAIRKLSRAGIVLTAPMLDMLTARFAETEEAAESLSTALASVQSVMTERMRGALTARFADTSALQFTVQAVERTAGAFTSVEDAMRKLSAAGVVTTAPMLTFLADRFETVEEAAETAADAIRRIVEEDVPLRLAAAAASAGVFGTQTELAAASAGILQSAIERILLLDPEADITELAAAWAGFSEQAAASTADAKALQQVMADLEDAQSRLAQLTGEAPSQWDELRTAFGAAAAAAIITREELEKLLETIAELERVDEAAKAINALASNIDLGSGIAESLTKAIEGISEGDLQGALGGLTQVGTAIGTLIGGPAVGALVGAIGRGIQAAVGLFQTISDLFTGDSPARRKLAQSLASTVAGAFKAGIIDGMKGGEDWQANLKEGVKDAVLGAVVDAFIQAAVMQAIFQPFIDTFTRILNRSGIDAAFAYFDSTFEGFWNNAMSVIEGFVARGSRYFEQVENQLPDPLNTGRIDLPTATVGVLAAPQWALELGTAATRIREAGDAMLTAAEMMQSTFQGGITVNTQSSRGVDAYRGAA